MVTSGLTKKVTFEQILKGSEGASHADVWGRNKLIGTGKGVPTCIGIERPCDWEGKEWESCRMWRLHNQST